MRSGMPVTDPCTNCLAFIGAGSDSMIYESEISFAGFDSDRSSPPTFSSTIASLDEFFCILATKSISSTSIATFVTRFEISVSLSYSSSAATYSDSDSSSLLVLLSIIDERIRAISTTVGCFFISLRAFLLAIHRRQALRISITIEAMRMQILIPIRVAT